MSNVRTLYSAIEGDFDAVPTTESTGFYAKTEQFPCSSCAGTGKYTGVRVHQDRTDCFVCRGKGYFLTSAADRAKHLISVTTVRLSSLKLLAVTA
jgi:DnaJ-class molecular chaperone